MKRRQANDYHPEVLKLFDSYVHGGVSRREFLDRAAPFTAGASAATILASLSPNYSWAQQIPEGDARISTQEVEYDSPQGYGVIKGYMVRPAERQGKLPGVVVVHENRGLNPYIKDVARRLGAAGFLTLAPDGLTPKGGYPGNDDDGRRLQAELDRNKLLQDFAAAVEHLKSHSGCTGKVGVVGFCFGGGVVNSLAVRIPDLAAGVSFYGRQPSQEAVANIQAPLLLHYAENDTRINEGWAAYENALKENGKTYAAHMYPGVNHGFHNDTTPRYDSDAAALAWKRSLEFFNNHLN